MTALAERTRSYLSDPTLANYEAVCEEIRRSPNYAPYVSPMGIAGPLLESGAYEEAVRQLRALLPGSFLSPSLHILLATAYKQLGDQEAVAREALFARAGIEGILLTGSGSEERPYRVLRISDEYDVLAHLGHQSQEQSLISTPAGTFDRHICEDGAARWFDIGVFAGAERG